MSEPQILARLYRGGFLESEHRGSIAVVDAHGSLIASTGDPFLSTFLRSSAKPFQALPVVSSGAAGRFDFSDEEIAIMTGSHSGEPAHVKVVKSILNKIGLPETALLCGVHPPFGANVDKATVLHNNCSGKHAGMLALAVDMGLSTNDYLENDHKVQRAIREALCELAEISEKDLLVAIDGCSAPNFSMPLVNAARAFMKMARGYSSISKAQPSHPTMTSIVGAGATWSRTDALGKIAHAMTAHPFMVAGTNRLDTQLMEALSGRIVTKGGAEGFQGVGLFEMIAGKGPIGIAIKISDGNGKRAMGPVLLETLRQLKAIDESTLEKLKVLRNPKETNWRGTEIGEIKAELSLRGA